MEDKELNIKLDLTEVEIKELK